jgi:hypothetical protein
MIQHKRRLNEVISAKFTSPTGAPRPSAAGPAVRVSARISRPGKRKPDCPKLILLRSPQ